MDGRYQRRHSYIVRRINHVVGPHHFSVSVAATFLLPCIVLADSPAAWFEGIEKYAVSNKYKKLFPTKMCARTETAR